MVLDAGNDDISAGNGRNRIVGEAGLHSIIRIGEEKEVKRGKKTQAEALGSGTDAFLAVEVSGDPDPLRQELVQ